MLHSEEYDEFMQEVREAQEQDTFDSVGLCAAILFLVDNALEELEEQLTGSQLTGDSKEEIAKRVVAMAFDRIKDTLREADLSAPHPIVADVSGILCDCGSLLVKASVTTKDFEDEDLPQSFRHSFSLAFSLNDEPAAN